MSHPRWVRHVLCATGDPEAVSEDVGAGALPSPLRHFATAVDEARSADAPDMSLAGERVLHGGDVATLTPPRDVHNHGHVIGTGPAPYTLVLLGDDMYLFERQEYDPAEGTWQALDPGDPGRSNR